MRKIKRVLSVIVIMCIMCSFLNSAIISNASQADDIVTAAKNLIGSQAYNGYCLAFCRVCYEKAGIYSSQGASHAMEAGNKWIISNSSSDIPVGACVFFDESWSKTYGHVGIYIGNGKMIDAQSKYGGVQIRNFRTNGYRGWGWYGGIAPTGSSPPSQTINYSSITEGEYKLQNATGKYLGVESGGNQNANVHAVNGDSSTEQKFRIKNTEIGNQYYIKSLANTTQYCVNAYTSKNTLTSQSDVRLWDENKTNSKYWGFEDAGGGYYYIRCMMNPQFVLTADGYNYPENVTVLPFDGRDTQKWKLVEVVKNTEYTITYNANGGSGGPSSQQKNKGQSLTLSSEFPERFGYSFVGWSTSSTAEKAQYIPGSTFKKDADTTLYAVWSSVTELSSKLGKKTGVLEFPYAGKCKYYKITPEKDGSYRFEIADSSDVQLTIMNSSGGAIGRLDNYGTSNTFYIDIDFKAGETYFLKIESKKAGTINYAFRKIYTLTYDTQGGTNGPEKQIKLFDVDIKTSSKIPTKEGYTFLGWSLSPDSTEVKIKSGSIMKYTGNQDDILYAVWEKKAHNHIWVWTTEKEPTCTETGLKYKLCALCGEKENINEIPATGHTQSEWKVVVSAEVGKEGLAQIRCVTCDEILDEEVIPALDGHEHVFTAYVTAPTCGSEGFTDYICDVCGSGYTGDLIKPTGNHIDIDNDYVCDVCSLVWEKNAHTHNWQWKTEKPTCTQDGKKYQLCECGETQNVTYLPHSHNFGEWFVFDEAPDKLSRVEKRVCSVCGETETQNIVAVPTPIVPSDNNNNSENSLDYDKSGYVTTDDAVYVLKHIMMPDIFELTGDVDFDKNGHETTDDAVYLLKHIMMPDLYPI